MLNNAVVELGTAANVARVTLLVVSRRLFDVSDPIFGEDGVLLPPTSQTGDTPPEFTMIVPVPFGKVNVPPGFEPNNRVVAPVGEFN
jgi:hypothetical protein